MIVYLSGSKLSVSPSQALGKGGEADVYQLSDDVALKLFKGPDHPDFENMPDQAKAAEDRLEEHQAKLKAMPKGLPENVITPIDLATDKDGYILGYTMPLVKSAVPLMRFSDRKFRQAISSNQTVFIFRELWQIVKDLHKAGVVIGDFNDLNVLTKAALEPYLIDADSMQWGKFFCRMFTSRFVDPSLCEPTNTSFTLAQPHNEDSDWYAFSVMLMQSMLFVDPYGGVYRPKGKPVCSPGQRPLNRITVFHPDVIYPKPALKPGFLPDELLDYFRGTFQSTVRGEFPFKLLDKLRWTNCSKCGAEHARNVCPECSYAAPALKSVTQVRGKVTATRIFKTRGTILTASSDDSLSWLYHEDGAYKRDALGKTVLAGDLDPTIRYKVSPTLTLLGKNDSFVMISDQGQGVQDVDSYQGIPMFGINGNTPVWLSGGTIYKGLYGARVALGQVLQGQTMFWIGSGLGFGFYRAGQLTDSFMFGIGAKTISDGLSVSIPKGRLVDASCQINGVAWFFTASQEQSKTVHRCQVVNVYGKVLGTLEAEKDDGSWLGFGIRGGFALGAKYFAPTDSGVVEVECKDGKIELTREYPDTEPFVDSDSKLFPGKSGIYVVGRQEITVLSLK